MATKPLGRIYFPVSRKTGGDAGRSNPDPSGVFSCNMNAARFLDINDKAIALPVMVRERKAGKRSITLADGTTLTVTQDGSETASTEIVLPVSGRGSRTVILKTGKLIADSQRVKGKSTAYHTISFRYRCFSFSQYSVNRIYFFYHVKPSSYGWKFQKNQFNHF